MRAFRSLPLLMLSIAGLAACDGSDSPLADAGSVLPPGDAGQTSSLDASLGEDGEDAGPFAPSLEVRIDSGDLIGTTGAEGALAFLGIPFAAPPTGALRFRAPEAPAPWREPLRADRFAPRCLQWDLETDAPRGSEDCLYLNVWSPPGPSAQPRPVLFFIHGGGNVSGSASEEIGDGDVLTDGSRLAVLEDAIVVTTQYRLGAFGYLVDPSLDADGVPSGNYGPRDHIAALQWVQRNIAAFGGDPTRVLLFGESAGATNTCALLATPAAAGLFASAAVMSGGCAGIDREDILEASASIRGTLGCDAAEDTASCLRDSDGAVLAEAASQAIANSGRLTVWAGPTIDGVHLLEAPREAIAAGRHHRVPLMFGTTAEETSSRLFGIPLRLTEAQYESRIRSLFPFRAPQVLERYPASAYPSPRRALVAVTTDVQFTCPTLSYARAASAWGPVHHYVYAHAYEGTSDNPGSRAFFGAAHGFELPLVFQTFENFSGYESTDAERALSRLISRLWASHARMGFPAGDDFWPRYSEDNPATLTLLAGESGWALDHRGEFCRFWAEL